MKLFSDAGDGNDNWLKKVKEKLSKRLRSLKAEFTVSSGRVVRTVGPRFYQIVLDILVERPRG